MKNDQYHFVIVGAGAAGLSLLIHMIHSGRFTDRRILLIDKAPKSENDRTWCFWEEEPGLFESIVYNRWNSLWFHGSDGSSSLHDIDTYAYKMIRGIDFYEHCLDIIKKQNNITVEYGIADDIRSAGQTASVSINGRTIIADYIFSSVPPEMESLNNNQYFLWQHFKGWFVKSAKPVFKKTQATLMDFRVEQKKDTRFVYVMPFSDTEALIEYTVLSKTKLSDAEYNNALSLYCENVLALQKDSYTILSEEFGMIPMTNINFPHSQGKIFYIGSAGGQTKASSGYTFKNIQKHSAAIVLSLAASGTPATDRTSKKFNFYDSLLLKILSEDKLPGADIFTSLFTSNSMVKIMKFLDNETSIGEDIKIISALPKAQFIRAAVSHILK